MNAAVFRHVVRQHRLRLIVVVAALTGWGMLMPIVYSAFGVQMREIIEQFPAMQQFTRFGGGDLFTLSGSIAVGYIHPIAIALLAVFAIVFPLSAVAGERQRGTLEVLLARPLSRRSYYVTLLVSAILFIGVAMAASLVGTLISAAAANVIDELQLANVPILWLNGVLFYSALASIALAASVTFDRMGPAAAILLAVVLVAYFLQIIGSLWPDVDWLQPYSLFHYLDPDATLKEGLQTFDVALLLAVAAIAVVYALIVFPRRDLSAPA
jgi:ABC-2 type transport system permease protein